MAVEIRVIKDRARTAAFNMAADLQLLERAADENAITLRFYSWTPPAISLGCMQKDQTFLNNEAMRQDGVEQVVRPTGGRALLHWNDITYSIVFPLSMTALGTTIHECYSVLCRCLMRGLSIAGIKAEAQSSFADYAASRRRLKLPCFLSANRHEIMVQGKKLIGSAQKRTAAAVLQHGSIPVDGSFRRLPDYLSLTDSERALQRRLLEEKCICLQEILPVIDNGSILNCLQQGFALTLRAAMNEIPWSREELQEIEGM